MRVWPASNTFRLQLCFSCRPREAAEPDKWCCDWLQDKVHWLMIPLSGADQSVETMTLKGHTWNVNEHYMKILLWTSRKISTLKIPSEGGPSTFPTSGACPHLSHNPVLLPRCLTFTFLSPKLQGLLCLCNLFPDPMSHWFTFLTSVIFYINFLLQFVFTLNSFLARTQVLRLLNQGVVWLHWGYFAINILVISLVKTFPWGPSYITQNHTIINLHNWMRIHSHGVWLYNSIHEKMQT